MQTKTLYVLISDGGDGSYYARYTFDKDLIDMLQAAYDDDRMDYENGIGVDGDGFHYDELQVPVECTYESLGITFPLSKEDYEGRFEEEDNE